MTSPQSQCSLGSQRPRYTRPTAAFCTLLLSITPLSAWQTAAPAKADPVNSSGEQSNGQAGGDGPVLSSSEVAQGAMLLHFIHAEGGLLLKGSGRGAFEIAGADHIWFPAEAHLVNGVVVVSTSLVQQPTAVRYTWSNLAAAALFNSTGLPVAPFHTDK
jgi:hypothetical protein